MKPICVSLRGVGRRDPGILSEALRSMADLVAGRAGSDEEDVDHHTGEVRRSTRWNDGAISASVQWPMADNSAMSFVFRKGPKSKTITLRHPALADMAPLKTPEGLSHHLVMLAELVRDTTRIDDPRTMRTIAVLDEIVEAVASLAAADPEATGSVVDRLSAPSPFREAAKTMAHGTTRRLRTTASFDRLMRSRLPTMVQLKRNGTRDLTFGMESMGAYFDTTPRSVTEVMRRIPLLGEDAPHLLEWIMR